MYLIFPFFLLLALWFRNKIKKSDVSLTKKNKQFWDREQKANSVRKKNIDNLDYITIPIDSLPFIETDNKKINELQDKIRSLSDKPILNLTGLSNTDIKIEYGVANMTQLTECDNNYITLTTTLAKLGELLIKEGFESEGIAFLEFGVECNTDISQNYFTLAQYYADNNCTDKIRILINTASNINPNSLMKQPILSKLNSF